MGIFDIFKKKEIDVEDKNDVGEVTDNLESEDDMIKRLSPNALNVVNMLKRVLSGNNGTDLYLVTLYASGLCGIACHEAVKILGKEQVVVDTKDGKKYYMGSEVNKYLLDNKFSPVKMIREVIDVDDDILLSIINRQTETIGTDKFLVSGRLDVKDLYVNIKDCWNGIFNNMTLVYCKSPDEWPIFFSIVLQIVVKESISFAPKKEIFETAVDCLLALSKMDNDSI